MTGRNYSHPGQGRQFPGAPFRPHLTLCGLAHWARTAPSLTGLPGALKLRAPRCTGVRTVGMRTSNLGRMTRFEEELAHGPCDAGRKDSDDGRPQLARRGAGGTRWENHCRRIERGRAQTDRRQHACRQSPGPHGDAGLYRPAQPLLHDDVGAGDGGLPYAPAAEQDRRARGDSGRCRRDSGGPVGLGPGLQSPDDRRQRDYHPAGA